MVSVPWPASLAGWMDAPKTSQPIWLNGPTRVQLASTVTPDKRNMTASAHLQDGVPEMVKSGQRRTLAAERLSGCKSYKAPGQPLTAEATRAMAEYFEAATQVVDGARASWSLNEWLKSW